MHMMPCDARQSLEPSRISGIKDALIYSTYPA
jgi:hypothetical protein